MTMARALALGRLLVVVALGLLALGGLSRGAPSLALAGELARAEAALARPACVHALFYNPARLISCPSFAAGLLTFGHNAMGAQLGQRYQDFTKVGPDKARQLEELAELVGTMQFLEAGVAYATKLASGLSLGVNTVATYESTLVGRVLPILAMELQGRLEWPIAYARAFLGGQLALGLTLRPGYRLDHAVHTDVLGVFEERKRLLPQYGAREGVGAPLDLGLTVHETYAASRVDLGLVVRDLGGSAFKASGFVAKTQPLAPGLERPSVEWALSYGLNLWSPILSRLELHAAGPLGDMVGGSTFGGGERLGASLYWGAHLLASAGLHARRLSYGLAVTLARISLYYTRYQDPRGRFLPEAPSDVRHALALVWSH